MRAITTKDLQNVGWDEVSPGWWRIIADLTCAKCGAYQAADSDPVNDRARAMELCAQVYNSVGWRVDDAEGVLCSECANEFVR